MWKYSKHVETPDIKEDIKELLSMDVLYSFCQCTNEESKRIVIKVVELLDLIKHMEHFRELLQKNSTTSHRESNGKNFNDNHAFVDGIDFSGCQYDIEALVIYLYVSCIEGCTQTNAFRTISDYFKNNLNEDEKYNKSDVLNICAKHSELYGLRKKFIKVFVKLISTSLRNEIADNIMILSSKRKTDFSPVEINSFINQWKQKPIDDRSKKIADYIYDIRSKYTHTNSRTFYPTVEWDGKSHISKYNYCLVTENIDFPKILKQVIIELCIKVLNNETL